VQHPMKRRTTRIAVMVLVATMAALATGQGLYGEAPQLAQRVAAGELPPVEERLPTNPLVVPVVERIGDYGGTWNSGLVGSISWLIMTIGYEHLVRWTPDWSGVIPNIAESFDVNDDATEFTFFLREGMRWSDGHPFTADDILFWYEDVAMNTDLYPGGPPGGFMTVGGQPGVVEKIDDRTVVFRFAAPNGFFLRILATPEGVHPTNYPKHYLSQFHPAYNPDIDQAVREAGAADWAGLWAMKVGLSIYDAARYQDPERPGLTPWVITTPFDAGARVVSVRNPYYWKVDPEGNQLPYLDRKVVEVTSDVEILVLKAIAGEIDMQDLRIATQANKPLFFDNQERGGYRFFDTTPTFMNTAILALNLTHQDPVKREMFQNKDFRIGLSHAINRQEIIDTVYTSQGEPWQAAPRPETVYYNEQLAKQYTEYSVALANEHLDRAGYTQRDAQGFRLGPDGRRIVIIGEASVDFRREHIDVLELIQLHWSEVGIDLQIRSVGRDLLGTRTAANQHELVVWAGDGGGPDAIMDPRFYLPLAGPSFQAVAWANWYTSGGVDGEEPPADVQRQMELYDQLRATAAEDLQDDLFREILQIAADGFYVMGVNLDPPLYGIVRNNFRNVPESMPGAWLYPRPGPTNPEQYFIDTSR
jgi:peptide/nickel transport system substrate-binding protein